MKKYHVIAKIVIEINATFEGDPDSIVQDLYVQAEGIGHVADFRHDIKEEA